MRVRRSSDQRQIIQPQPAAAALLPRDIAERLKVLPITVDDGCFTVAMSDPGDVFVVDEITERCHMKVIPIWLPDEEVRAGIFRLYSELESIQAAEAAEAQGATSGRDAVEPGPGAPSLAEIAPAVRAVDEIIRMAASERASDVHIEAQRTCLYVRFRVDGIMYDHLTLPRDLHPAIISRVKIMSGLDIAERRLPQDGRFDASLEKGDYDIRVSIIPTSTGEKIVLRLLPKTHEILQLEQLGIDPGALDILKRELERAYGMILVTGPTGSGKTTTLYAALSRIDCVSKNVITVEDPIEYEFPRVSQMQVHPKIGLDFAACLRHVLRQDPDVLMVGEIRDAETLQMAIRSGLTGHMVLSTVHCNDAASTPARLIDMGAEPFLIASCLSCIVAQRLVRCICEECKEEFTASHALCRALELPHEGIKAFRGEGCHNCRGTGYVGRQALFEVMPVNDEIRDAVTAAEPAATIRAIVRRQGVRSLRDSGISMALEGRTTLEEVLRVAQME
jgi:type II secretory ATPase GspE/PulE/Tfp pilus assembly ATPase PilB-like protein